MDKNRLKKVALLTMLSSMLLTGCGKTNKPTNEQPKTTQEIQTTTEITTEDTMVSNQTIAKIYDEYKNKYNKDINIENLKIEEEDKPSYIWQKGVEYIYDSGINYYNCEEYTYVDPGYHGKMYIVIVKNDDNTYEPIAALAKINGEIFNVRVTFNKDYKVYEPSDNYIIIDNPTNEDFENIKNADEYIHSDNKESVITKEVNDTILLQLKK